MWTIVQVLMKVISVCHLVHRSMTDRTFSCDSRDQFFVAVTPAIETVLSVFSMFFKYVPNIVIFIQQWLYRPFVGPWPLIQFCNHFSQTVGLLARVTSPSQGRYLSTGQHKHRINAHKHPCPEWDSSPRAFERAKTVHALDCAATVIGKHSNFADLNLKWGRCHMSRYDKSHSERHRRFHTASNVRVKCLLILQCSERLIFFCITSQTK
jgi:hypothetical protein